MLGVCLDLLDRCPNLPADTLGSRLCFDLFEDAAWATGLVDTVFRGFSCPDDDRAEDASTFLLSLVGQLDGGCVAEDSSENKFDGSDEAASCNVELCAKTIHRKRR